MVCSKCGSEVYDGQKFCLKCGNSLIKTTDIPSVENVESILNINKGRNKKVIVSVVCLVVAIVILMVSIITHRDKEDSNDNDIETTDATTVIDDEKVEPTYYNSKISMINYQDGEIFSKTVRKMNSFGGVSSLSKYDKNGIVSNVDYLYDGNKVVEMRVNSDVGNYNVVFNYEQTGNRYVGKAINITEDSKMEWEYVYENDKQISYKLYVDDKLTEASYWESENVWVQESTLFGVRDKHVFQYNEKSQLVCLSDYSTITSGSSEFKLRSKTEYTYDKNGNCIETKSYGESGKMNSRIVTEYNENNIPVSIEEYDADGTKYAYTRLLEETDEKIVLAYYAEDEIKLYFEYALIDGHISSRKSFNENHELYGDQNYNAQGIVTEERLYSDGKIDSETLYEYMQK